MMTLSFVFRDTLFYSDFDLSKMIDQFRKLKLENPTCSLVTVYDCAKDGNFYYRPTIIPPLTFVCGLSIKQSITSLIFHRCR